MQIFWRPKQVRIAIALVSAGGCAFFVAAGIVALDRQPYHSHSTGRTAPESSLGERPPDGLAILRRNIFDPLTGPLPKGEPKPLDGPRVAPSDSDLPPVCDGSTRLVASLYSMREVAWSFASLSLGGASPLLYRVGSTIDSKQVRGIYPEAVVLESANGSLCAVTMFERPNAAPKPAAVLPGAEPDPELERGITQLSATKYRLSRNLVEKVLSDQAELMRLVRVVPHTEHGQVVGVKLYGIRKSSLLGKLGLQNGDVLRTINGFDMASPDSALEALAKLRSASNLSLALLRRSSAVTMEYNITAS
jgi:general secretion pathway protein C